MPTKDDDQESIDLGQLNIRSYRVPILGGPLIALVLMEKFDLKFAVKWFFRFSIMPGGCVTLTFLSRYRNDLRTLVYLHCQCFYTSVLSTVWSSLTPLVTVTDF